MGNCLSASKHFKHLDGCKELPDVTLVVEETEIPAHRAILSERSEYFKAMFSNNFLEANSDNIILKETNLKAFERVLEYIYTNSTDNKICLNKVFKVLACAQFYMVDDLASEKISYLKRKCKNRPYTLLKKALAYSIDELVSYGTDLIQKNFYRFHSFIFDWMSPRAVEYLLKLRLSAPESEIFEVLLRWRRRYPRYSSTFPKMLEYIDLYLLDNVHLDMIFTPTQLIDPVLVQNLLSQQQEQAKTVQKIVNGNGISDFRLVEGFKSHYDDAVLPSYSKGCITVDLKQRFLLNCLKFELFYDHFYIISVSLDMRDWECVIDHSKYKCSGQQELHFNESVVRFIRIQCTCGGVMIKSAITAFCSTVPVEIDPDTNLIVPNRNIMPTKLLKIHFYKSEYSAGCRKPGKVGIQFIRHYLNSGIMYRLSQPYIIGSIKLLLKKENSYYVVIKATDTWTRVFGEENVKGWRTAVFEKQPVVFIHIVTENSNGDTYDSVELECPVL